MASLIFLSSLLLTASLSVSAAASGQRKVFFGGWEPIKNVSDPHVQEIARFAVDEHNKNTENHVKLINVVSGESQVVSGVNYRLVIVASSGGVSSEYQVIVWEKSWEHFRELTSFKPIKSLIVGGWEPIKNVSDRHVQEIARFAVDEHNKNTENHVKLINVVSGESQVVSGVNYRLVIVASSGGVSSEYRVIVWEKSWEHFRELTSFKPIKPIKPLIVGGWEPIENVSDPHVQDIVRFAIEEHNKHTENHVKLITVVRGESQIASGVKYRLVIVALSGGVPGDYKVIVWEKTWEDFRELTSFEPIKP